MIGPLSLRTSGVEFIMITLAFAQMLYFSRPALRLRRRRRPDHLRRSDFGGLFDLIKNASLFYYLCARAAARRVYLFWRIVNSRFGMVVRGCAATSGACTRWAFRRSRYKLVGFVIAALVCVLAGVLLANLTASSARHTWPGRARAI